jgi:hypothetical protein
MRVVASRRRHARSGAERRLKSAQGRLARCQLPLRRGSLSFRWTKRKVVRRGGEEDTQVRDAVA